MGQNGRWRGLALLARARGLLAVAVVVALVILLAHRHLAFAFGVVIFIVALLLSVMLHEFGHFVFAKKFHMRVTQFFVGFGHTLWSTFRGETEYGVKALPLGGYVRITGMTSMEEVDEADEPRSFRKQPGWQRMIVLAAGSAMHFALALVLLFLIGVAIGQANYTNVVSSLAGCVPASAKALNSGSPCSGHNLGKSPAQLAGLRANDKIISVDGKSVGNWNQLHTALKGTSTSTSVPIMIERDGHTLTKDIKLAHVPNDSVPYLGVESTVAYQRESPLGGVKFAGSQFAGTLTSSASAIGRVPGSIHNLFNSQTRSKSSAGQVSSIYGVGALTGDVVQAALPWQAKVSVVLDIVASLNIFVGAFNLLPLLPLDGGHLAVVIFERIRAWFFRLLRRPDPGLVDIQRLVPVSLLVFAVIVGFSVLVLAADIFNPVHVQV
jgi:membrane-associated protease RseP (regulator of RpoE activity)